MDKDEKKGLNPDNISSDNNNNIIDMDLPENVEEENPTGTDNTVPAEAVGSQSELSLKQSGLSGIDKMLETNISDWDYSSAKNYVVEFYSTAKRYKDDYIKKMEELRKWAKRVELARKHNKPELIEESERMFAKTSVEAGQLKNEYKKMKMHADVLREQLAEKNQYVPENDPSVLLNKLETILNKDSEEIELEKDLNTISLQDKLEALKNKIKKGEGE